MLTVVVCFLLSMAISDLNQTGNVTIGYEDRLGPVTTTFEPAFDYGLLFSWLFVCLFIYYYADKYHLVAHIRQRLS